MELSLYGNITVPMELSLYGIITVWNYHCTYRIITVWIYHCTYGSITVWNYLFTYGSITIALEVSLYLWKYHCMEVSLFGSITVPREVSLYLWKNHCTYGSIAVWLVPSFTSMNSTASLHTNNNIFSFLVSFILVKLKTSWTVILPPMTNVLWNGAPANVILAVSNGPNIITADDVARTKDVRATVTTPTRSETST